MCFFKDNESLANIKKIKPVNERGHKRFSRKLKQLGGQSPKIFEENYLGGRAPIAPPCSIAMNRDLSIACTSSIAESLSLMSTGDKGNMNMFRA